MLALLLGLSAALVGGAVGGEMDKPDTSIKLRTLNQSDAQSPMQWQAVELLSTGALQQTGELMDLDLARWADACRTKLYTVFILTDKSDGMGRAIAVIARKSGDAWVVDQAFGPSSAVAPADLVQLASAICAKASGTAAPYAVDLPADTEPTAPVRIPASSPAALPAPAPDFHEVEPEVQDEALLVDDGTSSLLLDDETVVEPEVDDNAAFAAPTAIHDDYNLDFGPDDGNAPTEEDGAGTLPL